MKSELKRAFFNKGMLLAIIIGSGINLLYIVDVVKSYNEVALRTINRDYVAFRLSSPFELWMISAPSVYSVYYFYIFPLLAVLPFSSSYCSEKKKGYVKVSLLRQSRESYWSKKYIAVVLSGGFAALLPSLENFMWIFTYRGFTMPVPDSPQMFMFGGTIVGDMYYSHPFVVSFLYLLVSFMIGGAIAVFALFISKFIENKFTVLILPMFLTLLMKMLIPTKYYKYDFMEVLVPNNNDGAYVIPGMIICAIVLIILYFVIVLSGRKKDCL